MRRLSGHEPSTPRVAARSERWLLHAYWALSGYGLRASRAFGALALTILLASAVFASFGFESPAPAVRMADASASSTISNETGAARTESKQPSAFEFAVRDSLALLRIPSQVPSLTGVGSVTDILLRLVAPVLLALGVLAIRGRTKR
jgi:hypothetical protein